MRCRESLEDTDQLAGETPCLYLLTLKWKKRIFSETLLCLHQATQRNIPENCDLTSLFEIYVYVE